MDKKLNKIIELAERNGSLGEQNRILKKVLELLEAGPNVPLDELAGFILGNEEVNDEYECDICKKIFKSSWSDKEAKAEAKENFGKPIEEWENGRGIACDDCYKKIMNKKEVDDE